MERFEKILVPLDGSKCAEDIISKVEKLATDLKAGIALLRVAYTHTFPGMDSSEAGVKVVGEAEEYLQKLGDSKPNGSKWIRMSGMGMMQKKF